MAEMKFKEWFVAECAKALAMLLLTRRDDLTVQETKAESGLDYQVHIRSEAGAGARYSGFSCGLPCPPSRTTRPTPS